MWHIVMMSSLPGRGRGTVVEQEVFVGDGGELVGVEGVEGVEEGIGVVVVVVVEAGAGAGAGD